MVTVNGKKLNADQKSVLDVIKSLQVEPDVVVAELNQQILASSRFGETILQDGDVLELVRFVGGG